MLILYGRRLLSCKLLKGMGLAGIYRHTGRNFAFFRGGEGVVWDVAAGVPRQRRGQRGRLPSQIAAGRRGSALLSPLRAGPGAETSPCRLRWCRSRRQSARLAVELGFDGYGDVSDGSHGQALQRDREFRSIGSVQQKRIITCKTAFGVSGPSDGNIYFTIESRCDPSGLMSGPPAEGDGEPSFMGGNLRHPPSIPAGVLVSWLPLPS